MPNPEQGDEEVLSFIVDNLVHIYARTQVQAICSVVILVNDNQTILIPALAIDRLGNPMIPLLTHPQTGEQTPLIAFRNQEDSDSFALAVNNAFFKGREVL